MRTSSTGRKKSKNIAARDSIAITEYQYEESDSSSD